MEQTTKNLKWTSPKKMVFFTLGSIVGLSLTLLAFEWGFYASVKPFASDTYVPVTPVEMPPILLPEDEMSGALSCGGLTTTFSEAFSKRTNSSKKISIFFFEELSCPYCGEEPTTFGGVSS